MGRRKAGVVRKELEVDGVKHLELEVDDAVALVEGEEGVDISAGKSELLSAKEIGVALADGVGKLERVVGMGMEGSDDDAVGSVEAGEGVAEGGIAGEEVAVPRQGQMVETHGCVELGDDVAEDVEAVDDEAVAEAVGGGDDGDIGYVGIEKGVAEGTGELVFGTGVEVTDSRRVVDGEAEDRNAVAAKGVGEWAAKGVDQRVAIGGALPQEAVAGTGVDTTDGGGMDGKVEEGGAVALGVGEGVAGNGVGAGGGEDGAGKGDGLVVADGVEKVDGVGGKHLEDEGDDAVGPDGVGECVDIGAGGGEGTAVPEVGQLGVADGVGNGGAGIGEDVEVVDKGAVAATRGGDGEYEVGCVGSEGVAAEKARKAAFGHGVKEGEGGGGAEGESEGGVVAAAIAVVDVDGVEDSGVGLEVVGGDDAEGGVAAALLPGAEEVGMLDGGDIAVAREALGIEGEGPAKDVAVVAAPAVNDFDEPGAVHGTPYQGGEGLVRVVELGTHGDVGGVEAGAGDVLHAVDETVARGVGVAGIGGVGPAVAPAGAGPVVVGRGVAGIEGLGGYGLPEVGADKGVGSTLPATAGGGDGAVAVGVACAAIAHDVGTLAVGTGDVDVDVAGVGVLDVEHDVAYVVDIGDAGVGGEVGEVELGAVGAAVGLAVDPVGEEDTAGLGEDVLAEVDTNWGLGTKAHPDESGVGGAEDGGKVHDEVHVATGDGDLVGVEAAAGSGRNKGVDTGLGDADGTRGLAGGPEVGVGAVGQEDEGVVVANGTHATDEGVEAGCAEGECAQTIGLRGVGKGGEEEGAVGIGGEIVDLAVAACNDGVNSGTRKMEGCSVGISMPGEGDGGDGEVGKGEVGYEVGAGCGMDCVVERKAGTVEHGVGGEVEGHDTRD